MSEVLETGVSVIENSLEILQNMGQVLQANTTRADKAEAVGRKILEDIAANGGKLTPELDERCKNYLANCAKASTEMNENRKAGTQIMDEIKKLFTAAENRLSSKTAGTPAFSIQSHRNNYAKEVAEEEARRRKEADLKAKKDSEAISIKSEAQKRLLTYFSSYLNNTKEGLLKRFNDTSLSTIDALERSFQTYDPSYPFQHFNEFKHALVGQYYNAVEIELMVKDDTATKYDEFNQRFKKEVSEFRDELLAKFSSKKAELEEQDRIRKEQERLAEERRIRDEQIAKANAEEKERLEAERKVAEEQERLNREEQERIAAEQRRREEEEQAELNRQAEERRKQEELQIEMNKAADQTATLFEQTAAIASAAPAPEARQGYEISVLNPAGWVLIFQFWFENEGMKLSEEKIAKTSLGQMKAYCEKAAHKSGTKIENKAIQYNETYKAVNRKG